MKQTILRNGNLFSDALQFITLNSVIIPAHSVDDFQFTQFKTVTFRQITPFSLNDTKTPRRMTCFQFRKKKNQLAIGKVPDFGRFDESVFN